MTFVFHSYSHQQSTWLSWHWRLTPGNGVPCWSSRPKAPWPTQRYKSSFARIGISLGWVGHWCKKVVRKCKECSKSQAKKHPERHVAEAEAMGQEDTLQDEDVSQAHEPESEPVSDLCCMYQILSLQEDFAMEKPMLQHYIESCGHVCMFLPKFHCELNPIEMLWGFAKYCEPPIFFLIFIWFIAIKGYHNVSNGKFPITKTIVPQCLNMCDKLTIHHFFLKTWRYMDSYLYIIIYDIICSVALY